MPRACVVGKVSQYCLPRMGNLALPATRSWDTQIFCSTTYTLHGESHPCTGYVITE
uniref:Uncharacterized protein n=1 Tax=Oryza brachyantha TaxID=4533 RepID=J3L082_ORYBR